MAVFVDFCVLLDVFTEYPTWFQWSAAALERAADEGPLVINAVVYAEISVRFERIVDLGSALASGGCEHWPIPRESAFLAGKIFLRYRRAGGRKFAPLPDFVVGADATVERLPLLTRDVRRFRTNFSSLQVLSPGRRWRHKVPATKGGGLRPAAGPVRAAALGGMAFANASVALVHGMSRPIRAVFHVLHGLSNAMRLDRGRFDAVKEKMASDALASGSPQNNPVVPTVAEIAALYDEAWWGMARSQAPLQPFPRPPGGPSHHLPSPDAGVIL